MDQIQKSIQANRLGIEENIDAISKGKALPIGTIKKRSNGNFIRTATGWKYHSKVSKNTSPDKAKGKQPFKTKVFGQYRVEQSYKNNEFMVIRDGMIIEDFKSESRAIGFAMEQDNQSKKAKADMAQPKKAPKIKVTRNDNPHTVPQSGPNRYTAQPNDAKPLVAGLTKVMKQSGVDGDWTLQIMRGRPNNMGGTGNYYRMKSDNSTSEYKYIDIFGSRAVMNHGDGTLARVELYGGDGKEKHRFDMGFYESDRGITEQEQAKKDKLQSIIGEKTAIWAESAHVALLDYALKQAK